MDEKTLLAAFVLLLCIGLAALIYWSGPRFAGWDATRTNLTSGGIAVFGLAATLYAYWITDSIDSRTLFETRFPGNPETQPGDPIVTRQAVFTVEHPNTAHKLLIGPKKDVGDEADFDIHLVVRIRESDSSLLMDQSTIIESQTVTDVSRNNFRTQYTKWDGVYLEFVPRYYGEHRLEIDLLLTNLPDLYIWIEDPLKTDGIRDPSLR